MRLDHVSYVASHDQISDVVNRIGSQIGTAFVDGGIHPKFGTRNFTAPLLNNQYIEIVCPLDHPATDATPFGQAVKKKADAGGGWLSWILAVEEITKIEKRLGRNSIPGQRKKPDGSELNWKQIGVLGTLEDAQLPFFIEWISNSHPSTDGVAKAKITKLEIVGNREKINSWVDKANFDLEPGSSILNITRNSEESNGIVSVEFDLKGQLVVIL
jgi:hypothetical protein